MKSINTKLTIVFLLLTLIPLIITITIIMTSMEKGFTNLMNTQQDDMIHIVEAEIDAVASELQTLTERYATDATFIEALQSKDRDALAESVAFIYPRLKEEHHLSAFEFGDLNGVVLLRGHNPAEYGDNKKDIPAIQLALTGESIAGFEFGKSGLSVRAFAPIIANGQIIATLQTAIDASFIEQLSSTLQGVAISLHNIDGEVMFSSHQDKCLFT